MVDRPATGLKTGDAIGFPPGVGAVGLRSYRPRPRLGWNGVDDGTWLGPQNPESGAAGTPDLFTDDSVRRLI